MRTKQTRAIMARLAKHDALVQRYVACGADSKTASERAYESMRKPVTKGARS